MTKTFNISLPTPYDRALEELTSKHRDKNRSALVRQLIHLEMTAIHGPEWFRRFEDEAEGEGVA